MSRYKKAVFGEMELEEIGGIKFLIYPTLETRYQVLEIFKNAQRVITREKDGEEQKIQGDFNLKEIIKTCTSMIYEGCFNHDEKGNRKEKKEFETDTTEEDIRFTVMETGVFEIYMNVAKKLGILSNKKVEEIKKEFDSKKKQDF